MPCSLGPARTADPERRHGHAPAPGARTTSRRPSPATTSGSRYWFGFGGRRQPTYDEQREPSLAGAAATPRAPVQLVVTSTDDGGGRRELRRSGAPATRSRRPVLVAVLRPARPRVGHPRGAVLADWALTEAGQGGLGLAGSRPASSPATRPRCGSPPAPACAARGCAGCSPGTGDRAETREYVVLPGSATTRRSASPQAFRALLNSFLPRKRAICQMLLRDDDGRVLLCQLTYKQDWDLPGGVVEVGESPQLAGGREVEEELGLRRSRRAAAPDRLAPPVGRLGRRAVPGLRRRHPPRRDHRRGS